MNNQSHVRRPLALILTDIRRECSPTDIPRARRNTSVPETQRQWEGTGGLPLPTSTPALPAAPGCAASLLGTLQCWTSHVWSGVSVSSQDNRDAGNGQLMRLLKGKIKMNMGVLKMLKRYPDSRCDIIWFKTGNSERSLKFSNVQSYRTEKQQVPQHE